MIQQIVGNKVGRSFSGVNPAESSCLILADQCLVQGSGEQNELTMSTYRGRR